MDEDPLFKDLYDRFIQEFIAKQVEFEFHYQRFPTFRIHQPDNVGVFEFHKDKDYNHSEDEINIFMPMTKAYDSNTVWAESEEDKGDFSPMELEYGELFMWNGANLTHGNKINVTKKTRVSFDYRIIPVEKYNESDVKSSLTSAKSMSIDNYFQKLV
jgi:ectoine hydroxylase-related dioxygenase (phytanoyl-CoA dioxygenase family)